MGWLVNVPKGTFQLPEVDQFIIAIDEDFPNSQPRIFAPAAGSEYRWPHVEKGGLLCLRSSRSTAPTAERVTSLLHDAQELLNFSKEKQRDEFEREFIAYWGHRATEAASDSKILSIVTAGGVTREVLYFYDAKNHQFIIADDKASLLNWLRNVGVNPDVKQIFSTRLFRLTRPWIPEEFPCRGEDVTKLLEGSMLTRYLIPGKQSLFLFEAKTSTGAAFAAVVLNGAERKDILKGFRHISKVPVERIVNSYAKRPIKRCRVSRIDGAWVHGRGHPSSHDAIKRRKVVIVGCGAIGSALAFLLAQAGVGEIAFVDDDNLSTANLSRHALGMKHIGFNKAVSLQRVLKGRFPHLSFAHAFAKRFQRLDSSELDKLADADLIVAAGVDFDGETLLDKWRITLPKPPAYMSTWAEAYAVAGHAVLLYGNRSILTGFDDDERPSFRLTDWPEEASGLIVEAGCGNSFQPHGVVDLHPTVGLAAGLALDTLLDKVRKSCRRVWMGDSSVVERNGGMSLPTFTDRFVIREYAWQ
jgi:hypothetical protein